MIRHAEEKDIMGIMALLDQVLLVHHLLRKDIFKPQGAKYTVDQIREIIQDRNRPLFVYVDKDDNVIGHIFCQIKDIEEKPNTYKCKTLYIDDLVVDKNNRGRHIGTALYEYAKDFALVNGFYNITLSVWEGNSKAKAFYDNLGMKPQQVVMEEVLRKKK